MPGLKDWFNDASKGKASPPPIMATLGMELLRAEGGEAKMSMRVDRKFHNPMGTLHGGVMTDIADACMGLATISTLKEGETFTTLELKMNFLRPVIDGRIECEAKVFHRGRTVVLAEAEIKSEEGKTVAKGMATQLVIRQPDSK